METKTKRRIEIDVDTLNELRIEAYRHGMENARRIVLQEPELPIQEWRDYVAIAALWIVGIFAPIGVQRNTVRATKHSIARRIAKLAESHEKWVQPARGGVN